MKVPYLEDIQISLSNFIIIAGLVANSISWYYLMGNHLESLLANPNLAFGYVGYEIIAASFYLSIPLSSLIGTIILSNIRTKTVLLWWIIVDIALLPLSLFEFRTGIGLLVYAICLGVSVGFGFPRCLKYFSDYTSIEERGRVGGSMILLTYLLMPLLAMGAEGVESPTRLLMYAGWRGLGLILIPFIESVESSKPPKNENEGLLRITYRKRFLLYFTPWVIFSLTNGIDTHVFSQFQPPEIVKTGLRMMYISGSFSSVLGGIAIDYVGRRTSIIFAMVIYGVGYAALSFAQTSLTSWLFFTISIGIAWGLLSVAYVLVLWGELGSLQEREMHYAIGMIPFFLSQAVGYLLTHTLSQFSSTHLFSVATLLYFLAVIPLLFAEEVLPTKIREQRRMREYIRKAKQLADQGKEV